MRVGVDSIIVHIKRQSTFHDKPEDATSYPV